MILYNTYQYLYPPRAELAMAKNMLPVFEKQGLIAQYKKNGTSNVIFRNPDHDLTFMTRHKVEHRAPGLNFELQGKIFKEFCGDGWFVFCAELLHSKTPTIKNTNYIHDILVNESIYLIGSTQIERQKLLRNLFEKFITGETKSHYVLDKNTWVVKEHTAGFLGIFDSLSEIEDEGLVLKDPKAVLAACTGPKNNSSWQFKCRKPTKNYGS